MMRNQRNKEETEQPRVVSQLIRKKNKETIKLRKILELCSNDENPNEQ